MVATIVPEQTATAIRIDGRQRVPAAEAAATPGDAAALAYRQIAGSGIAIVNPLSYAATIDGLDQAHGQHGFLTALSAGHQLVYFDQRGSGGSANCGTPRDWQQRGEDLWAVADAAGVERAVLYGVFDAGATIAYAAAQRPDRVLGLVFNRVPVWFAAPANCADGSPATALERWFSVTDESPHGHAEELMDAVAISAQDAETLVRVWEETAPAEVIVRHAELLHDADLRAILPALNVPALVLAPKRRPAIAAWGAAVAALLPMGRAVYPENAGEALGAMHAFLAILGQDVGRMASRLSPSLSTTMTDSRRAVGAVRKIIVPVDTSVPSSRAVELACRLGEAQKAEVLLVHVIVVPHSLPLDRPMPEATLRAERSLTLGEAIAAEHGLPGRSVLLRERSAAGAIVRLAKEEAADLVVMSLSDERGSSDGQVGRTAAEVLRRSPCEVLLDRGAVR